MSISGWPVWISVNNLFYDNQMSKRETNVKRDVMEIWHPFLMCLDGRSR